MFYIFIYIDNTLDLYKQNFMYNFKIPLYIVIM